jgi:hypothetical protein
LGCILDSFLLQHIFLLHLGVLYKQKNHCMEDLHYNCLAFDLFYVDIVSDHPLLEFFC